MSLGGKKIFIRKTGNSSLYKWSPQGDITDKKSKNTTIVETCTAQAYQINGNDSVTKYVSNPERINDVLIYNAYVECDYVQ
jgi:hypothetical protein